MARNMESQPSSEDEKEPMPPDEILDYIQDMGKRLERAVVTTKAMIEEAKEKGIPVDLSQSEILKKFAPMGEYEVMLVKIQAELNRVGSELFNQGVKMTEKDLNARLKKMGHSTR